MQQLPLFNHQTILGEENMKASELLLQQVLQQFWCGLPMQLRASDSAKSSAFESGYTYYYDESDIDSI